MWSCGSLGMVWDVSSEMLFGFYQFYIMRNYLQLDIVPEASDLLCSNVPFRQRPLISVQLVHFLLSHNYFVNTFTTTILLLRNALQVPDNVLWTVRNLLHSMITSPYHSKSGGTLSKTFDVYPTRLFLYRVLMSKSVELKAGLLS